MYQKIKDEYEDTKSALAAVGAKWKAADAATKQKYKAESEKVIKEKFQFYNDQITVVSIFHQ